MEKKSTFPAYSGSEPIRDWAPEDVVEWRKRNPGEAELADAYAVVSNKYWWVEDNVYDYAEGSPKHQEACRIADAWGSLYDRLREEIFIILRREGITIPKTGYIETLKPFMERHGYENESGWYYPIVQWRTELLKITHEMGYSTNIRLTIASLIGSLGTEREKEAAAKAAIPLIKTSKSEEEAESIIYYIVKQ